MPNGVMPEARDNAWATLLQNSADYEEFVQILQGVGWERDPEGFLQCAEQVAMFCYHNHTGRFADGALENRLLEIGAQLDSILEDRHLALGAAQASPLQKRSQKRRRVLHVAAGVFRVGGVPRTIVNWIRNDQDSCHSLLLTRQENPREIRTWISDTVLRSGGQMCILPPMLPLLVRAKLMRDAARCADVVVVHQGVEAIPVVAYGTTQQPPIAVVNHSDHLFWFGCSIADSVVHLRSIGIPFTDERRFARHTSQLLIPMERRSPALSRREARLQLGIPDDQLMLLSVARESKYIPDERQNFMRTACKILEQNPAAHLYVVGVSRVFAEVQLAQRPHPRVHFLGQIEDPSAYQHAADVYLESFPFGSQTALLEAALAGVAPVHAFSPLCNFLTAHDDSTADIAYIPCDEEAYIEQANRLLRNTEERCQVGALYRRRLIDTHTGEGWHRALAAVYAHLDRATHAPRALPIERCSTSAVDLALCAWHDSQKRASGADVPHGAVSDEPRSTIAKMPLARDQRIRGAMLRFIGLLGDHDHVTSRLAPLSLFAYLLHCIDASDNPLLNNDKEDIRRELFLVLARRTELARWRRRWAEYWAFRTYLQEQCVGQPNVPSVVNERVLPRAVYWIKDHVAALRTWCESRLQSRPSS